MSATIPFPLAPPAVRHPRAGFETIPPDLSRTELLRYFTFSELDRREIAQCRGAHNRIGFALLLGGVRLTGRFPHDFELLPRSLLSHVCVQLEVETPLFLNYPQRRPTRHEHKDRLKDYLCLRAFTDADQLVVRSFVGQQVRAGIRLHELLGRTEQMLRQQHTVLPGLTVLERLISVARAAAEEELYQDVCRRLDQQTTEGILSILQKTPEQKHNLFQRLQRAAGRPSPEALEQELSALDEVRALLPAGLNLDDISMPLLERLAGIVSGMPTQAMLRLAEPKRVALLVCWLWRLRTQMIDAALTIGNELIAGVFRRAKNAAAREQKHQYQRTGPVLKLCSEVVELLLDQTIPDPELRAAVFARWSNERIKSLATECQTLSQPPDTIYVAEVRRRYGYVRQFAPRLLEAFVLRAIVPNEPLLEAVDYLREQNQHKRRSIEADALTDFVPSSWQARVCPAPAR